MPSVDSESKAIYIINQFLFKKIHTHDASTLTPSQISILSLQIPSHSSIILFNLKLNLQLSKFKVHSYHKGYSTDWGC